MYCLKVDFLYILPQESSNPKISPNMFCFEEFNDFDLNYYFITTFKYVY